MLMNPNDPRIIKNRKPIQRPISTVMPVQRTRMPDGTIREMNTTRLDFSNLPQARMAAGNMPMYGARNRMVRR